MARSNILAFQRMGAKVTVAGPPTLIPRGIEALGCEVRYTLDELASADVVYALRMQRERMSETWVPSLREYASWYQINGRRLSPRQVLMHPGPVNRGVELSGEVVDSPQAVITAQVEAGVVVRMAVLYELLAGASAPLAARSGRPEAAARRSASASPRDGRPAARPRAAAAGRPAAARRARARPARRASTRATTCACATGAIAELAAPGTLAYEPGEELLEGQGRHLLPAFFDPHVHLRTPGQEHKEDLETRHARRRRRRLRGGDRDAQHRPRARLGAAAALAARRRRARGAHPGRLSARRSRAACRASS